MKNNLIMIQAMTNNIKNISEITKELEKLLKTKQEQYGSFTSTSNAFKGMLESILTSFNGYPVRCPNNIFGICMTLVKLWRSITNKKYKKDTYDDINGYNELNRNLKMEENNGK